MADHSNIVLGVFGLEALDKAEAPPPAALLERALSLGIRRLDCGFPELGEKAEQNCAALRSALREFGNEMELSLAIPVGKLSSLEELRRAVEEKLALLGLGRVERCIFGPLNGHQTENLEKMNFSSLLSELKSEGLVSKTGLWISDRPEVISRALSSFSEIDCLRFDYTPMDFAERPGTYGFRIAHRPELELMVGGADYDGRLSASPPEPAAKLWAASGKEGSLRDTLLQWWVSAAGDAALLLSPSTLEELSRDAATVCKAAGKKLSVADQLLRNNLRDAWKKARPVVCTACGCCMPCPVGLDIPGVLGLYNDAVCFGESAITCDLYHLLGHDHAVCIECGKCDRSCPKANPVSEIMSNKCGWLK